MAISTLPRSLILLTVLTLAAATAYLAYLEFSAPEAISPTQNHDLQAAREALQGDAVLSALSAETLMLFRLDLRNFEPLKRKMFELKGALLNTSLAQKHDLEEKWSIFQRSLLESFQEGVSGNFSQPEPVDLQFYYETVVKFFERLELVTVVASAKRFRGPDNIEIPYVFVELRFVDGQVGLELIDKIDVALVTYAENLRKELITVEKRPADSDQQTVYVLSAVNKNNPEVVFKASAKISGKAIRATLFTDSEEPFFSADPTGQLLHSASARAIESSYIANGAYFFMWDGTVVAEILEKLEEVQDPEDREEFEEALNLIFATSLGDLETVTYAQGFKDAVTTKQCVRVKPQSVLDQSYAKLVDHAPRDGLIGSESFLKYIEPKTLLAFSFSGGAIRSFLDTVASQYRRIGKIKEEVNNQDDRMANETLDKMADICSRFDQFAADEKIKEFALRLDAVDSTPIPAALFYLSSFEKSAGDLLGAMEELINSLAEDVLSQAAAEPPAKRSKGENGVETLEISVYEGLALRAMPAGSHALQITLHGPFLASPTISENGADSYLESAPYFAAHLQGHGLKWSIYSYVNSGAIINASKSYWPLLLAGQNPDDPLRVEIADLEEISALFAARLFSPQSAYRLDIGAYCFDSELVALD